MPDKLDALKRAAATMREISRDIADLELQLEEKKAKLRELQHNKLPDMFVEAGVDQITLAGGTDFVLKPYYRACIAASWPGDKRRAAFDHLEEHGFGDVIKRTYKVELPKGAADAAVNLERQLADLGLSYASAMDVPWQTLTALVREQFESGNKKLNLDLIGGQAGMIVTVKGKEKL